MAFKKSVALALIPLHLAQASPIAGLGLSDAEVAKYASVRQIQLEAAGAKVLTDNSDSFDQRIQLIRSAKKSIEMAYYILSSDQSSSYLLNELVVAANQRNVRVRVLVDYSMGYPNLDLLSEIERRTERRVQFRFFNRPTANIIKDAVYMSTACSASNNVPGRENACAAEKAKNADILAIDALGDSEARNFRSASGMSAALLSGIYAKSGTSLGIAVKQGAQFDPSAYMSKDGKPLSEEEKSGLREVVDLYLDAKGGSPLAALKLQMATWMHGDRITNFLGFLNKLLPTGVVSFDKAKGRKVDNRKEDWDHISDFLHHKLLIVDDQEVMLGGRNIENSYHLEESPGKYTFMDTDVYMDVTGASGVQLRGTFDRLWNYTTMVASLSDVWSHAPNDVLMITDRCMGEALQSKKDPKVCIAELSSDMGAFRVRRATEALDLMVKQAAEYPLLKNSNPIKTNPAFVIDANAKLDYVENLPFNTKQSLKTGEQYRRLYGASPAEESINGKGIHGVITQSLLGLCSIGNQKRSNKEVYLYQAYWLPPSNVLNAMAYLGQVGAANAYLGTKDVDCSNVTVRIITNSIPTTDLSIINVLARHQMHEFFKALELSKRKAKAATFEYYEYDPSKMEKPLSMHSKVWLTPDAVVIGSANGDLRSYMMDTNNGVVIRGAKNFVAQYSDYLSGKIKSGEVARVDQEWRRHQYHGANATATIGATKFTNLIGVDVESLALVDMMFANAAKAGKKWPTEGRRNMTKELVLRMGQAIRQDTVAAMQANVYVSPEIRKELEQAHKPGSKGGSELREARQLYQDTLKGMQRLDDRFQLF